MHLNAFSFFLLVATALAATSDQTTVDSALESLLTYPTWVIEAIDSAEPTAWASSFRYDEAFFIFSQQGDGRRNHAGLYNNLPESVKRFESTRDAAIEAYEITASQDLSTSSSSFATATATATTSAATSTATSSSNGAVSLSSTDSVLRTARAAGALGLGFILAL